MYLKQI